MQLEEQRLVDYSALVVASRPVAPGFYEVTLEVPEIARSAKPGQFVFVRPGAAPEDTLRRAFSVHRVNPEAGFMALLIQVKGPGTRAIVGKHPGAEMQVLGPLGRWFTLGGPGERVALVGGGAGVAPLLFLAERLAARECRVEAALGFRSSNLVLAEEGFRRATAVLEVVTDDGSNGCPGAATNAFRKLAGAGRLDRFYACGPAPMLRSAIDVAEEHGIPGEISVEANLACGIGACRGCAIQVIDRRTGEAVYQRVCADGPVFEAREVVLR